MIRTAILAGILLVMLSMAYSRPGTLPSLDRLAAPAVEEDAEAATEAPPVRETQARAEAPRPAPVVVEKEEPTAVEEPAEVASAPVAEEPQVAEIAPAPVMPVAPPAKPAEIGRPISLLPEAQAPATPVREAARIAPLVSDEMPAPPAPTLPSVQEAKAAPIPAAELPEVNVPTRPVMAPQDFASRLTPEGTLAPPPAMEPRAPVIASGQKFMTPEERSRELYRLAREMEDTFIQKLTQ